MQASRKIPQNFLSEMLRLNISVDTVMTLCSLPKTQYVEISKMFGI